MPNKLRVLSGREIIKFLEKNSFVSCSVCGSHAKLKRIIGEQVQTLVIPLHDDIAKGTLRDIYDQILKYLPESSEIRDLFFTE